jgi:hypothetical protein
MQLIEVQNYKQGQEFLELPLVINKNDTNYIRPLDADVLQVFDPEHNPLLKEGKCIRWILKDNTGKTVGRIAAFVNPLTAWMHDFPVGSIGFFDCIDNKDAAFLLFDIARQWLEEKGMQAMEGPENLGSRERWWGVLAEGFYPPCYCCNYNPPYYQALFESYGFQLYFKQYTYIRKVHEPLKPLLHAVAARVIRNQAYSFKHLEIKRLDKYTKDFMKVYNKAWVNHQGVEEMNFEQAHQLVYSLKPVIDERIIWFAYYNDEPIGFFISIPELNQLFVKYVGGKLDSFGKLRLLYNKWTGNTKSMYGLAFGIVPEHQRKGVDNEIQMNWIGDFNPRMMHVAEQIGANIYKTHHTYRYLFDNTKEFVRHPEI